MMPTPHQVIGSKFAIDGICLLFATLRTLATRKRQSSKYTVAANVCLFLTFAADLSAMGICVWTLTEEHKIIQMYDGDPIPVNKEAGNPIYTKIFYIAHFFYYLSLIFLKMAYLSHYAQLFIRTVTKKKAALHVAAVITFLCFLASIFLQLLWCQPLSDNWNPYTTNPNCPTLFSYKAFSILAWINIVTDIFIIAIPLLIISDLRLNRSEKFGFTGIFIIGGSSILVSIIRYIIIGKKILNMEFNWDTLHVFALMSHSEVLFGIIAFSLPAFRPFLSQAFGKLTGRFTSQGVRTEYITSAKNRGGTEKEEQVSLKVRDTEWGDSREALKA